MRLELGSYKDPDLRQVPWAAASLSPSAEGSSEDAASPEKPGMRDAGEEKPGPGKILGTPAEASSETGTPHGFFTDRSQ